MSEQATSENRKPRILSGMRPTGRLHLGNLVGALQNWVDLQDRYESYHFVADWHMLTTDYANTADLQQNIQEMVTDWLAAGLDPAKCVFFQQSRLLEHAELHLIFSMLTPLGWLERVPTYKEALENIKDRDIHTYGFLGYPVLQAADILMYKADFVPVGEDQVPHVELTREIARKFNLSYSELELPNRTPSDWLNFVTDKAHWRLELVDPFMAATKDPGHFDVALRLMRKLFKEESSPRRAELLSAGVGRLVDIFPEPRPLLTPTPRLPGTDGRKMSKSYGNAIYLSDPPDVVSKKVAGMMTDPARKRRTDPGDPDVCPVFDHHKIFSAKPVIDRVNRECRTAEIGCVDCKKLMAAALNERLAPIQERRRIYEQSPKQVWEILEVGTARAHRVAETTMAEVRQVVGLVRPQESEIKGWLGEEIGTVYVEPLELPAPLKHEGPRKPEHEAPTAPPPVRREK